jgi:hypothetical protein
LYLRQVCKLVLSLDPQDPMGVLCCMDYYALMAEQYAFIPRLVEDFDSSDRSLALRPGGQPTFVANKQASKRGL